MCPTTTLVHNICDVCFKVIDAEILRRELLEKTPIASVNQEPVNFDTSEIPWWAWVKRFHLPEVVLFKFALLNF